MFSNSQLHNSQQQQLNNSIINDFDERNSIAVIRSDYINQIFPSLKINLKKDLWRKITNTHNVRFRNWTTFRSYAFFQYKHFQWNIESGADTYQRGLSKTKTSFTHQTTINIFVCGVRYDAWYYANSHPNICFVTENCL